MSSPITTKNFFTILTSPKDEPISSDMEISPSPPYIPLTLMLTPLPKPRQSPKATMMKTGGYCCHGSKGPWLKVSSMLLVQHKY
jgi:hypothetical protein